MLAEELQLAGLVGGEQLLKHQPTFQACHSAPRVGDWPWGDTDGHGMIGAARGPAGEPLHRHTAAMLPRRAMLLVVYGAQTAWLATNNHPRKDAAGRAPVQVASRH